MQSIAWISFVEVNGESSLQLMNIPISKIKLQALHDEKWTIISQKEKRKTVLSFFKKNEFST